MSTVLVTGGSGYLGSFCILQLLQAGHQVRTTVRNLQKEPEVRAMIKRGGVDAGDRLRFFAADLNDDKGWKEATTGCEFVLHVASPFPAALPKHPDELIVPAREGTRRVLRAARDAGVKRVVLTSSFAAIGYGHPPRTTPFTEADWTVVTNRDVAPYPLSKTLAERAAWDFVKDEGGALELSVVNPVAIFGPILSPDFSTSIVLIQRLLDGSMPGCPQISFGVVDVRDVADLHLRAMTHPAAKGERFLAVSGPFMSIQEIAKVLKHEMGPLGKRVPTRELPNWLVRVVALFDATARMSVSSLGVQKNATHEKAKSLLGWAPRTNAECLKATGESLSQFGLLRQ